MSGRRLNLLLLALVVALVVVPLLVLEGATFGGTDAQAQHMVGQIAPGFQPWASPIIRLPGPEIESLLFALQAALGAGTIGYVVGRWHGRREAAHEARNMLPPAADQDMMREQG
ncbi:MAG TPA: energy-coupling factor ABC transporter substrate-binding protein [Herpetosiphonaceae bacterium]|nr:energy-coupling factor ABC transporter substrate-binding protein [Herpetosiphonaceae bacterium]